MIVLIVLVVVVLVVVAEVFVVLVLLALCSPCRLGSWVHRTVELHPSGPATDQRTPTHTHAHIHTQTHTDAHTLVTSQCLYRPTKKSTEALNRVGDQPCSRLSWVV